MIERQTSLSKNIVQFCRFLREKNFSLSVEEEASILIALQFIDYSSRQLFFLCLKSLICKSQQQLEEFDSLFYQYWKETEKAIDSKIKTKLQPISNPSVQDAAFKSLKSWLNGNRNNDTEQMATYSLYENLSQKDFSSVPADELDELTRTVKILSKQLAAEVSRRYQKSNKVREPDLRRTLRLNMRWGGELLEIVYRKPKHNPANLVVLCDVSKSMDLYSVFLLQFMYAMQQVYRKMETFTFGTSLQHITSIFRQNDFAAALQSLKMHSESWSGGTRIGENLHTFIKDYAPQVVNKRTIIIILSDGWDTGNITLLQNSMEIIKATSKKVIWLNPLAGYSNYYPAAAGMKAALPFIDVFAPVHNAASLKQLGRWL